ncbi:MAG: SAM-dependent methyltransferase [Thermodesulfobacteriota bacterium]
MASRIRTAVADGKNVAVLGSGDLMIYGGPYRWYLAALDDLDPEIIAGVSCLNAANAMLGRDIMLGKDTRCAVLMHYRDIDKFAGHEPTLVIFTMHTDFADLVEKLKTHYPPATPIAIAFYAGDKEKEFQITGRLDNILEKTKGRDFPFEHLVYVGDFLNV